MTDTSAAASKKPKDPDNFTILACYNINHDDHKAKLEIMVHNKDWKEKTYQSFNRVEFMIGEEKLRIYEI